MENTHTFTVVTSEGPKKVQIVQCPVIGAEDDFFYIRPETNDFNIFDSVVQHNEYGLPDRMESHDVLIDIGAHIGSFTYAALMRGAARVYAFEAHPINYVVAVRNLERFGDRAVCRELAVWRSDSEGEKLFNDPLANYSKPNTGGFSVVYNDFGLAVQAIGLDEILLEASEGLTRPVDLLKIDCEGAEYPILFTSKYLAIVKEMCGEYHEIPTNIVPLRARVKGVEEFNRHSLKRFLEAQGFAVELTPHGPADGIFHARRKSVSPFLLRQRVNFSNHVKALPFWNRKQEPPPQAEAESNPFTEWKAAEPGLNSNVDWDVATPRDVYYCYRLLLNREPDPDGWRNWTSHIRTNKSLQELVALFMDSEEYRNKSGSK
ncbi:MAG TPA: FkbM family methyltransferase [Pyrinomonadaceae bacterium]|jgi:FkbM family methyltransferase|nr:FkbM family methyltransferase [Pyrinomonadaceae bacterium]